MSNTVSKFYTSVVKKRNKILFNVLTFPGSSAAVLNYTFEQHFLL